MARDDLVRLVLFVMTLAGLLLSAAALGDLRHLRCMLFAGLTLTVVAGLAVLRVQLRDRREPAAEYPQGLQVVDINSAPSVAALAAQIVQLRQDNALLASRVDCHAVHLKTTYGAMRKIIDGRDATAEIMSLRMPDPARQERSGSLCPALGAGLAFVAVGV